MDLNRIGTLLHCADLLVQWPNLAKINSVVMRELQEINDSPDVQKELDRPKGEARGRVVTPADGPANSGIQHRDGGVERLPSEPRAIPSDRPEMNPPPEAVAPRPVGRNEPNPPEVERKI